MTDNSGLQAVELVDRRAFNRFLDELVFAVAQRWGPGSEQHHFVRDLVDGVNRLPLTPTSDRIAALEEGFRRGIEAAAAQCLIVSGIIGATNGSSIDSALGEAATAIRSLFPDVGAKVSDTPPQSR